MLTLDEVKALSRQDPRFLSLLRARCESSFLDFVVTIFPLVYGLEFKVNRHHRILAKVLEAVYRKEIKRLVINIPPGYSKTELVIILFAAWCFAKEPRCRFMHTSYSDDLALTNSSKVKDIVSSEIFQMLWGWNVRTDSTAKKMWSIEGTGGYFIAAPMSGQITGRRAGVLGLESIFSGALLVDDPMKPEDGHSTVKRTGINRKFRSTVRNRVATEDVPIILIMQRLHKTDLAGFLLSGGTGEKWHHLSMPAKIETEGLQPTKYRADWTHGKPIKYRYDAGPLWTVKHTEDDLQMLMTSDAFDWGAQYMQNPVSAGTSIFAEHWWRYYRSYDPVKEELTMPNGDLVYLEYKSIFADTAMKTEERHDFSVFELWGKMLGRKAIALLDLERGKWTAPDLEDNFKDFILKHQYKINEVGQGIRRVAVEDKASGIGLIQTLNRDVELNQQIEGVPRDKDKVSRAKSGAPSIKRGEVYLPEEAHFLGEFMVELTEFNEFMTHDHDDQVDPMLDAINHMLINGSGGYEAFV